MAANFQDRLLDELMPLKLKVKEAAIVEDVAPAYDSNARLPAVWTTATAVVKASALKNGKTNWRGTCPICLHMLPFEDDAHAFYECCSRKTCTACASKC